MSESDRDQELAALRARIAELEGGQGPASPPPVKAPEKKSSILAPVLVVGAAIVVISAIVNAANGPPAPDPIPATTPVPVTPPAPPLPPWRYTTDVDEMTDKKTQLACTVSTNDVRLDFPYKSVPARLCIRQSPKFGLDAYVELVGDGQFICRSYDGCSVSIRFGKAAASKFSATDAADGSSNIVFITNPSRLIAGLRNTEKTLVSATFYQAGVQTMEFDTKDFTWPPKP